MSITDDTYTFTNVAFPSSQLTLLDGRASGRVVGSVATNSSLQQWNAKTIGSVTTIKSGVPGITSFVSVSQPIQGAPLVGSSNTFNWVVVAVSGGGGEVYFKVSNQDLAWFLTSRTDGAPINLQPFSIANIPSAAQWTPVSTPASAPAPPS